VQYVIAIAFQMHNLTAFEHELFTLATTTPPTTTNNKNNGLLIEQVDLATTSLVIAAVGAPARAALTPMGNSQGQSHVVVPTKTN